MICLLAGTVSTTVFAAVPSVSMQLTEAENATDVTSTTTTWNAGTYIVKDSVTINQRVEVNGNVTLILADGCDLAINGGIHVKEGNSLTINAGTDGTGKLTVTNVDTQKAGIGGNSSTNSFENSGAITINGGIINVTGGNDGGAGIGSGRDCGDGTGPITITGGTVTATGGTYGAGIGGGSGSNGGNITITGGTINAVGGCCAAGIGGGSDNNKKDGDGGNITIQNAFVTATGGNESVERRSWSWHRWRKER